MPRPIRRQFSHAVCPLGLNPAVPGPPFSKQLWSSRLRRGRATPAPIGGSLASPGNSAVS
jgi:hypothetical protein